VYVFRSCFFQTTQHRYGNTKKNRTQDETIDAEESDVVMETVVEIDPREGDGSNDERSNSSSDNESDCEAETPDGTAGPIGGEWQTITRSGRTSRLPLRYHTEIGAVEIMTTATTLERNYYEMMLDEDVDFEEEDDWVSFAGAGIGGKFKSAKEILKYK
jgi:hypothetical protein